MEKNKQRLDFIDVAKGIGMLFVIYAHVNYNKEVLIPIYSFHMPLFFIISGMLFDRERFTGFGNFMKKRFFSLIVPYLVFSFLAIGYAFVSERMFPEIFDFTKAQYLKFLSQVFLARGSSGTANTPLWFVPCLLMVEIIYYFISRLSNKIIVPLVGSLAALGWLLESGLLPFDNKQLPWTLDSALFALSFYAFGNLIFPLLKAALEKIRTDKHPNIILTEIFLLSLILWYPLAQLNGKVTLGSRILHNGILFFMTGVIGSIAVFALSLLLERCSFLKFCGRNSFIIMSVHYVFRRFTVPKIYYAFGYELYNKKSNTETILPFIIVFVLSIGFTFLYSYITNKLKKRKAE